MRAFLRSPLLKQFEVQNPECKIIHLKKNGAHPVVFGDYITPQNQTLPEIEVKKPKENQTKTSKPHDKANHRLQNSICVKNKGEEDIINVLTYLRNKRGGKNRTWNEDYKHVTQRPSIQGVWHPDQWCYTQMR